MFVLGEGGVVVAAAGYLETEQIHCALSLSFSFPLSGRPEGADPYGHSGAGVEVTAG